MLDRANTIEFNEIRLDQFPENAGSTVAAAEVLQVENGFLRSDYLQLVDVYAEERELVQRTTEKLMRVNRMLEHIHSHVGFRIRDAVCFYLIYNKRFGLLGEDEAYDLQLLQKLLPRVQGSSAAVKRVLLQLMGEALGRAVKVDHFMDDAVELYEEVAAGEEATSGSAKYLHPLSARKLAFMLRRLEEDGFTSYWLS